MRRPVWIALPFVALLFGAAVYELASEPERPLVSRPVAAKDADPAPTLDDHSAQQPLDGREVLLRAENAPSVPPPGVPPLDQDRQGVVSVAWASGGCRIRAEVITEKPQAKFSARVADVVIAGDRRLVFADDCKGEIPRRNSQLQVHNEAGEFVCFCRLIGVECNPDTLKNEPYLEVPDGADVREGYAVVLNGVSQVHHGLWQQWRKDGSAECQGRYYKGKRDGEWTWWHANGTVAAIGSYQDGERVGTWRLWYDDGKRHGVWEKAKQDDKYRGWQVWGRDGETHPCYDSASLDLVRGGIRGVKERRYQDAVEHFEQLAQKLRELPEEYAQDRMLHVLKTVQGKLETILTTDSEDTREGERLLLLFVDIKPLEDAFNSFAPKFPE